MATKQSRNGAVKRSVSAPRSLWKATEDFLKSQMPPVPVSRHVQELMARDLRERGLLVSNGKEQANAA